MQTIMKSRPIRTWVAAAVSLAVALTLFAVASPRADAAYVLGGFEMKCYGSGHGGVLQIDDNLYAQFPDEEAWVYYRFQKWDGQSWVTEKNSGWTHRVLPSWQYRDAVDYSWDEPTTIGISYWRAFVYYWDGTAVQALQPLGEAVSYTDTYTDISLGRFIGSRDDYCKVV